ncbi:MAG: type II secretion system protein [Candidatus Riflebacteria bacterium HGW-Riflebacteria-1]|jgi:tight adherence protein C|nr:MAG: type II secretion system protein [Candidatus Riflebacteria bacterium HGW-Riflebacteria-1]
MNILFIVVGGVIVFLIILLLFPSGNKSDIQNRLAAFDEGMPADSVETIQASELNKPFVDRVIRPFLAKMAGKRDPKDLKKVQKGSLKKELAQAGYPGGLTANEFAVIQNLFRVILPAASAAFCLVFLPGLLILGTAMGAIIGFLGPRLFLQRRIAARLHKIQRQLPDVLDLLTVAVEAGLGFDAACDKVVEKMRGPIPEEFSLTLRHMRMGQARRDAFKGMADRVDHPDLNGFVSAIIQADQLGVSIGQVLRIQSEQLREKRRQRAEEEAAKAPVKMMIPLVFFIFPNVGIVIGAPAAFQIIDEMSKANLGGN